MDPKRVYAWLKAIERTSGPAAVNVPLLTRPFLDDFIVTLAHDAGDRFELLQRDHLSSLGLDEARAFQLGVDNLTTFAASGAVALHDAGGMYAVIAGGNFEASLLLVRELWADIAEQLGAKTLLAAVPARDLLAIALATTESAATLRNWVESCAKLELTHRMSPNLYEWAGEGWHRVDRLPRAS